MDNVRLAINYLIENGHKMVENNNNYAVQSIKLAIEALEKQIPKEPNYQCNGYVDGEPVSDFWECPCCGAEFEINYDRHWYCPECGQAIDWEVKE